MPEVYRIIHLPRGSTPREILISTPIPGESRVPVSKEKFPSFACRLEEAAECLGGRAVVFLNYIEPFNYSSAIVSWREVTSDNLGSRFVRMEGLEKDSFELETPFNRFLIRAIETGVHLKVPKAGAFNTRGWERVVDMMIIRAFGKDEGEGALQKRFRNHHGANPSEFARSH